MIGPGGAFLFFFMYSLRLAISSSDFYPGVLGLSLRDGCNMAKAWVHMLPEAGFIFLGNLPACLNRGSSLCSSTISNLGW